jgi:sn-glycerol 3-phosphate transport system ATP-binding protein
LGIRPEDLHPTGPGTGVDGGSFVLHLRVTLVEALGADTVVHGLIAGSQALAVRLAATSRVAADDRLALSPDLGLFDPTTGRRLDC